MLFQPALHSFMFARRVVLADQMNLFAGGYWLIVIGATAADFSLEFSQPASGRFLAPEGRSREKQETGLLKSALALWESANVLNNFSGREI